MPDYYVTRDLFYPVFAHPYSYYQTHLPDLPASVEVGEDSIDNSTFGDGHTLRNVSVKAKRRTRRALDYSKPAYVADAYDVYNDATDRVCRGALSTWAPSRQLQLRPSTAT